MKEFDEKRIIIAGIRRANYPRDEDWMRLFETSSFSAVDFSKAAKYESRWGHPKRIGWISNLLYRHFGWLLTLPTLMNCIRKEDNPCVFIFRNNHLLLLFLASFRKIFRWKFTLVFDAWISLSLKADTTRQIRALVRAVQLFECHALAQADRIIVLSEQYGFHFKRLGAALNSKDMCIVTLSAGPEWEAQGLMPPKSKMPFFIYWGNFLEQHGTPLLLEAVAIDLTEKWRLKLCGEGKERYRLMNGLAEDVKSKVDIPGYIENGKLIHWVDQSVAAFGHLKANHDYNLVLPNKAIQAFSRGKPIFMVSGGFSFGGSEETATHPAIFFDGSPADLANQMNQLLADPSRIKRLNESARDYYQKHHSFAVVRSQMVKALSESHHPR